MSAIALLDYVGKMGDEPVCQVRDQIAATNKQFGRYADSADEKGTRS